MSSKKPGTGPARKQKQYSGTHCPGSSSKRSSPSSLLREVGGPRGGDVEAGVFRDEAQKSLCLENQSGAEDSQIDTNSADNSSINSGSCKSVSSRKRFSGRYRKYNKRGSVKDRWGLGDIIDKAIQDCRVKEQTADVPIFDLEKLCVGLGDAILTGEFDFNKLQDLWKENSGGLVINFENVNQFGFDNKKDLRKQVLVAFDLVHSLEEKSVPRETNPDPVPTVVEVTKETTTNDGKMETVTVRVEKAKKRFAPLAPHLIKNVVKMEKNDDLGQYQSGAKMTKKVTSEVLDEIVQINQIKHESKSLPNIEQTRSVQLEVDIAKPVIDNIAVVEKKAGKNEVPSGFVIKYRPSWVKRVFFGRKKQDFLSSLPANHNSKDIRKQAKKGGFRYDTLPDRCIIPSLHSYLVRRRDVSYPDYKTKLAHLHKLAKAWENDEMPLAMHKATPQMLNNYYLTISKVANCTDIELIVVEHQEDKQETLWQRIRASLFGHRLLSD